MKMTFRGWRREVKPHTHSVTPVEFKDKRYSPQTAGGPLKWESASRALGKVTNLALSGAFLIEFDFEEKEIQSWLSEYVKTNPVNALRMLGKAQAEAIIALHKAESSDSNGATSSD